MRVVGPAGRNAAPSAGAGVRMQARALPNRRLHLNDGPIDLIIGADGTPAAIRAAYAAAAARFATVLDELCAELPLLRRQAAANAVPEGAIARSMWRAVSRHRGFITPMAAVAGSVADAVLRAMTDAAALDRAHVNNGGDIALHLAPGHTYAIGLVDRPDRPTLLPTRIEASGGIATSGWRGRSFSRGIADAVTVLAGDAATADAAATVIANAVDLPGHPAIARRPASDLQPDSDLGPRLVTTGVGALTPGEVGIALDRGADRARALPLVTTVLRLGGQTRVIGRGQG